MFRHPNYYKELRKLRNKEARVNDHSASISDQVISKQQATASGERSPGPGPKRQASSNKLKETQASSGKHQAPSTKAQA